jgi:hypothetical protein
MRRVLLAAVALVAAGVVIDILGGGKHPVTLAVVALGGGVLLVAVAAIVPGRLLARPSGSRPGELGWGDDQERPDGNGGNRTADATGPTAPTSMLSEGERGRS